MERDLRVQDNRDLVIRVIVVLIAVVLTLTPLTAAQGQGAIEDETPTPTPTLSTLEAPRLSAVASGADTIDLNWTSVPGAVRYALYSKLVDDPGWQQLDNGNLKVTLFRHGDLTPGETYQYAVRALDANDEPLGPWSNFPTATTSASGAHTSTPTPTQQATPTPTASTLKAPRLSAIISGANAIDLHWTSIPGAARYALFSQLVDDPGWQQLDKGNLKVTLFRHGDLTPGETYQYAVRAFDTSDEPLGPWSNFPTATASASGAPTSTPTSTMTPQATPTPTSSTLQAEKAALAALYNSTGGANWTHRDNWLTGAPLGTWYGVTTDSSGGVTKLNLGGNGLRGPIPDLSGLSHLTELFLPSNFLSGPVPDLSALSNLTTLSLFENRLTGSISELGAPSNLRDLNLGRNQLTGPISHLTTLSNLTSVWLARNQLTGPIPDLSALSNLTFLNLSHNRLSGSIPPLNALTSLGGLDLAHNRLTGPFPDLSAVPLRQLNFTANQLCLPPGFDPADSSAVVAAHLKTLSLQNCTGGETPTPTYTATPGQTATSTANTGSSPGDPILPPPILSAYPAGANAIELRWSSLPGAARFALFTQLVNDPGWQQLDKGNLKATFFKHSDLTPGETYQYAVRAFDANGAPLGPWSNFPTATASASGANTSTPTPTPTPTQQSTPTPTASTLEAPRLSAIASGANAIDLRWTSIPGAARYALFSQLVDDPGWQQLDKGNLKVTFFKHSALTPGETYQYAVRAFDTNGEPLGPWSNFPTATASASTLQAEKAALAALYNSTGGANWTQRDNWLTGAPLGTWYGVTADLSGGVTKLNLGGNGLRGPIPDLSGLSHLTELFLPSNFLSGPVPDLSALSNLTTLSLFENRLTGSISELGAPSNLRDLNLGRNQLTGPISHLTTLSNLTSVWLARNQLTGPIPDLSALSNLTFLNLSHNRLSGPIPPLDALTSLGGLDLAHNRLTGPFPDLSAVPLRQLNFTANQLCLPPGFDPADSSAVVAAHLRTLSLLPCDNTGTPT